MPSGSTLEVRTSASHPLRVDWVEAPSPWRVGITLAPGKHTLSTEGFRWERDLAADLDALVSQGVGILVCLLETDEMARLGIPDLLAAARARGLHPIHAPIRDVSVPSAGEARAWIAQLLEQQGRPIVVHCNGGLGRSGVIAGCLLRALGLSGEEARRRLQTARGERCPETDPQRAFIDRFSPASSAT